MEASMFHTVPPIGGIPLEDQAALTAQLDSVSALLSGFLASKERGGTDPQVSLFVGWLRQFLIGGKRLRPLLCCCGWHAAGAQGDPAVVAHVAASLELFHAFALIHDDIMDGSDTRRGRPTMHRLLADGHPGHPAADRLGVHVAILLGDLALGWSYDLVQAASLDPAQAAPIWAMLDAMRIDTLVGQYLDLLAAGEPDIGVDRALTIARNKTAKYTVEYPLQLGALLAGADQDILNACSAYGTPLGEAFQLRDDLLGVFGDHQRTGKPAIDDLRQGKATVLLAMALQRANPTQSATLRALIGDPDLDEFGATQARDILKATGARAAVEDMIVARYRQAMAVLETARFSPTGIALLSHVAASTMQRDH
jgi:geranylgeranyl diphosphate synthase type I